MTRLIYAWALACAIAGELCAAPPLTYFTPVPSDPATVWEAGALRVDKLAEGGPAQAAGLCAGDRLVGCAGVRVRNDAELKMCLGLVPVGGSVTVAVVRAGNLQRLTIAELDEGRLGAILVNLVPPVDGVAMTVLGIHPGEYLGTKQGGRPDGGALDALLAAYTPTNNHQLHPVLNQLAAFPARGTEAIQRLASPARAGARDWVLGLLKTYYALLESRAADARRHLEEGRLLDVHLDPFLDGLAGFYAQLAASPPGAQGADLAGYGVTPEYFALCFPPPVLPIKRHDWTPLSPAFAADFERACSGAPWDPAERDRAARQYEAPYDAPAAERYVRYLYSALVDQQRHGGWPIRFEPMMDPGDRAELLATMKRNFATNVRERVLCALALVAPSAVEGDLETYRAAMTVLRDAGSRELAEGNVITRSIWNYHWSPARASIYGIHREINESLGIDPFYRWLAEQEPTHAERFAWGWFILNGGGFRDGTGLVRSLATVNALGGPVELSAGQAAGR